MLRWPGTSVSRTKNGWRTTVTRIDFTQNVTNDLMASICEAVCGELLIGVSQLT
jgi:hypothetical protein